MDYLLSRWNLVPGDLLQTVLRAWLVGPMERHIGEYQQLGWGCPSWKHDMETRADKIAAEPDKKRRDRLVTDALVRFQMYVNGEAMFLLELAVWKTRMSRDSLSLHREQAFHQSGAEIVLQNVDTFLGPSLRFK